MYISIGVLCLITEGRPITQAELDTVNIIGHSDATPTGVIEVLKNIGKVVTWKFSFFESGFGVYIRYFLYCLSAAVFLPIMIEVARLVFKPFS
jgi:hypothetical protein